MNDRLAAPQPAPELDELEKFPPHVLDGDRWIFRLHLAANGVWYFSSTNKGRFNLPEPRGTCYAADTLEAAVIETLGPDMREQGGIAASDAAKLRVTPIRLEYSPTLADLEADNAWKWNVSREIASMRDYAVPQVWAAAFDAAGFEGIRYLSRYTTGTSAFAYALFGDAGAPDPDLPSDPAAAVGGLTAISRTGIPVIPDDDLGALTVAEPDWPDPAWRPSPQNGIGGT